MSWQRQQTWRPQRLLGGATPLSCHVDCASTPVPATLLPQAPCGWTCAGKAPGWELQSIWVCPNSRVWTASASPLSSLGRLKASKDASQGLCATNSSRPRDSVTPFYTLCDFGAHTPRRHPAVPSELHGTRPPLHAGIPQLPNLRQPPGAKSKHTLSNRLRWCSPHTAQAFVEIPIENCLDWKSFSLTPWHDHREVMKP